MQQTDRTLEWIEADGLSGFASGTMSRIRTRRYRAWLLSSSCARCLPAATSWSATAERIVPRGCPFRAWSVSDLCRLTERDATAPPFPVFETGSTSTRPERGRRR